MTEININTHKVPLNKNKIKSIVIDLVQFSSLIFLIITGPLFSYNFLITIFQIVALILVVLAIWEMRLNKFYRVPDVGKQERLISSGIYRYIRHPMYTAQIFFAVTLLTNYFSFFRLSVFVLLLVDFLFKIRYEESLLEKYFDEYKEYKKKTYRLVPFLY